MTAATSMGFTDNDAHGPLMAEEIRGHYLLQMDWEREATARSPDSRELSLFLFQVNTNKSKSTAFYNADPNSLKRGSKDAQGLFKLHPQQTRYKKK